MGEYSARGIYPRLTYASPSVCLALFPLCCIKGVALISRRDVFLAISVEPRPRVELGTSPLPWARSTN